MDTNTFVPLLIWLIVPPIIALGLWGPLKLEISETVKWIVVSFVTMTLLPFFYDFQNAREDLFNLRLLVFLAAMWLHTMLWVRIYNRLFKL